MFDCGKYKFHDVGLNPSTRNAYHALLIDERRTPFRPNRRTRPESHDGYLEQAWFADVHSNVGGSSSLDGLANEALYRIVEKAKGAGLAANANCFLHYKPCSIPRCTIR